MSHLLLERFLLLFSLLCFNKLLIVFMTQEKLIVFCLMYYTSTQNIKMLLFNFALAQQYQLFARNRLNKIISSIQLRGINSLKMCIKTCLIYMFCLEVLLNKLLFYSFVFSECLYSRNCDQSRGY